MNKGIAEKTLKDKSSHPSNSFCPHFAPEKILDGLKRCISYNRKACFKIREKEESRTRIGILG